MITGSTTHAFNYVYDVNTLSWVSMSQPIISTDTLTVTLPATAATSPRQDTGNTSLASIDGKAPALVGGRVPVVLPVGSTGLTDAELRATPVPVSGTLTGVTTVATVTSITNPVAVTGTFWQVTQPVSAASLPLPADAATQTTLAALNTKVTAVNTGAVVVASGSITANAGTNLNTSALALAAAQTDRTQFTKLTDGTRDGIVKAASTLPLLTDTALVTTQRDPLPAGTNVLGHVIADTGSTTAVTGNVTVIQPTGTNLHIVVDSGSITANAGTNLNTSLLALEAGGNLATLVTNTTSIATAARQDTGNTSLGSIDTKLPAQVAGRVPVDGSGVVQPVSGPLTDAQLRAATVPVSGTVAVTSDTLTTIATNTTLVTAGVTDPGTGAVVFGRVDDSHNSYAPEKVHPLSLTTDGRLRVSTDSAMPSWGSGESWGTDQNYNSTLTVWG